VAKTQSKGYKESTSNTTFVSHNLLTPKKSDPSLSLPNKPLSSSHHQCHMSIRSTEIKACWRRRSKTGQWTRN